MFDNFIFKPIFNLMLFLYNLAGDFGVAIILFAIIIKTILYPSLKSQLLQSKKMQDMKPKLKKIKADAKGNKQVEYMMTMQLYKDYDIKMSKTFIGAIIQLPIIIAMFQVIRVLLQDNNIIVEKSYDFIKNLPRIAELINNNAQITPKFFIFDLTVIPFQFQASLSGIFAVLVLLGTAIVFKKTLDMNSPQANNKSNKTFKDILNEAGEGKQPDQAELNGIMIKKMNNFMPIMIVLSFGALYSGMAFYSLISSCMTLVQRYFIMKDVDFKKEVKHDISDRLKEAKQAEIISHQKQKINKKSQKSAKKK